MSISSRSERRVQRASNACSPHGVRSGVERGLAGVRWHTTNGPPILCTVVIVRQRQQRSAR